jgi:hypothetical protein
MTPLNESFDKELQRMTQLAGIEQKPGSAKLLEAEKSGLNSKNKIVEKIQENVNNSAGKNSKNNPKNNLVLENDDLFGDFNDIFTQQFNDLQGRSVGKLNKDLKAAMVLNNVSEFLAVELDLYTNYKPTTTGAQADPNSALQRNTIFDKKPVEKIKGAEDEFNRLQGIGKIDGHKAFVRQSGNKPVTFTNSELDNSITPEMKKELAKWHPLPKDESIISYHRTRDKNGYETFTLSDKGKEQLEFLQRMLSIRPLSKTKDPNVDIETELVSPNFPYRDVVTVNAEKIIRDFFTKAVTPIVASLLRRTKAAPKDSQFERFVEVAVDHAIDATKAQKYNSNKFSNYGAWFIQIVKNKVIDQLKAITTFQVDTANVYDMLSNMPGPLNVDSQLNPKEAQGNYSRVIESNKTFVKNGVEQNYYTYIYNKPEDAIADLDAAAVKTDEGFLKSPLKANYLREPSVFYKSFIRNSSHIPNANQAVDPYYDPEDVKTTLARTSNNIDSLTPEYFENYEDIPAATVIEIANKEIQNILEEIAKQIVVTTAKVGDEVKLSGRENAKYPTLTKGKSYEVVEKGEDAIPGGGIPKKFYKVIDDTGATIKVSARALTPTEAVTGKTISKVKENEATVVELLKLLLQYGRLKPVYTKTVYFPKDNNWILKNKGETALTDRTGRLILPYANKKFNTKYNDLESAPIDYVWSSEKQSDEVSEKLIEDISKVAKEKGLTLPSQYFTTDNEPLYKQAGVPTDTKAKTVAFINSIRNALRKFFGFSTLEDPIIKQNRDVLKKLIDNWKLVSKREKNSLEENESRKLRNYIREFVAKKLK